MSTHWSTRPWKITKWRTEYPETFPVITTRKDTGMDSDLRPIDYNGHVPDEPEANPKQGDSTLLTGLAARFGIPDDSRERDIWFLGYLAACAVVAEANQAGLDEILRRAA